MLRLAKLIKNLLLYIPITLIFSPFNKLFGFLYYFNSMISWIYKHKSNMLYHDFFSLKRDYSKRLKLYDFINQHFNLSGQQINYLEFGVASGASFKWWLSQNTHPDSVFTGFDTFEGLPEDWGGFYAKGDMSHPLPEVNDQRAHFIKGLFQNTLVPFIQEQQILLTGKQKKIIHLDADLYTATIFSLAQLYPYLNKGDLILFDEFNVPMHEYKAFCEFTEAYYINLKPIASVNNFYQTAFVVE